MIKKIYMDSAIKGNATSIIEKFGYDISNIRFNDGFKKIILYHTSDIWLSKRQFICLKKFLKHIGESEFIITQMDAFEPIVSDAPIFLVNSNIKYSEYYKLPLYDTSLAFSKNEDWAICIEEGIDYGTGIMAVKNNLWEIFKQHFSNCKCDFN